MGDFDLSGHVTVVTGANRGIGLGIARGLARANADVAIWGRDAERNAAAVEELDALGAGKVAAFACDVCDEAAVAQATDDVVAHFGRIDSVFANAGGGTLKPFLETTLDDWNAIVQLDLTSVFCTFQKVAAHMIERGGSGKLVAISSIGTTFGMPLQAPYAASKAGVEAMCRSLAVGLARYDIQVNAVEPGWIETPMTAPLLLWDKFNDTIIHRTPARRWGNPDDLAGVAVYLASPASRFHTGDVLRVDGGYSVF